MEFPPGGGTVPLPKSLHQPSTGPFVPDAIPQSDGSCVPVRVTAGLGEFRKESVVRTSGARGRGDTHDPADVHTARAGLEHVPRCEKTTISVKLAGKSAWSVSDLVNAANFLDATPDELMNDAFMNELGMKKHQDRQGVPVGAGTPPSSGQARGREQRNGLGRCCPAKAVRRDGAPGGTRTKFS